MNYKTILCYSPYNSWELHGLWEITILKALRLRGALVNNVYCDGIFKECDIHWEATNPRNELSCVNCQAAVTNLSVRMNNEFEWLNKYSNLNEQTIANQWVSNLSDVDLSKAKFDNWEIGEWVKSSVHSHFRINEIDIKISKIRKVYKNYMVSGLIAAFAIDRLINEVNPDTLLLFNGRMSSLQVAYQIARKKNIDVYVHERGVIPESITLAKNSYSYVEDLKKIKKEWALWENIPLNKDELDTITDYLNCRKYGKGFNWKSYNSNILKGQDKIKKDLCINNSKEILCAFTSSMDEIVSAGLKEKFKDQFDWLVTNIEYAINQNKTLIIRIHPNTGGKKSTGINSGEISGYIDLEKKYRGKVKFIFPDDDINSYDLMQLADIGIVYNSTVGLEMACMGKTVVVGAETFYDNLSFIWTAQDKSNYENLLSYATKIKSRKDTVRQALRFAYYFFFRASSIKFPYVKMPDPHNGILNYSTLDDLLPGKEKNLDRICNIILNNEEIIPTPQYSKEEIEKNKILETVYL